MKDLYLGGVPLSLSDLTDVLNHKVTLILTDEARNAINACRNYLDRKIAYSHQSFYGINTGFGSLCHIQIAAQDIEHLQKNLVLSHACGVGEMIRPELIRLMILLKIQSLAQGHSGISLNVILRLLTFYQEDVLPVIYEQGSLGASGDLAPLAHLSLPLLNQGKVWHEGTIKEASTVCALKNWAPLKLRAKEGLALLNGTQFMSALGCDAWIKSKALLNWANVIGALSMDAFMCKTEPLMISLHEVRPHQGQKNVAATIRQLLSDSVLATQVKEQVQDPYSFRCMPQVHGATDDVLCHAQKTLEIEINAVTDNPTIFPDEDLIISGGNFHGQPLALTFDFMAIAVSELASISERRLYLLLSGQRGLPMFLSPNAGLESGLMITQYTAASLVSQNKQLSTPASVDSIVSSNGQEDHVSMGANGATKLQQVINNTYSVLAIELFAAVQALRYRTEATGSRLQKLVEEFNQQVPVLTEDRLLHDDLVKAEDFLRRSDVNRFIGE